MAEIIKKKISELPEETLVSGMHTIVVTPTGSSAKTNLDKVIENETAISEEKDRAGQAEQAIANNLNKHVNSSTAHKSLFDKKVNIANIVNDLISLDTDKPASANTVRVLKELIDTINETLQSNDITLDTIQKIVDYIKNNRSDLDNHIESNTAHKAIFDTKVNVSDIINNLTSTDTNKPASANTVKTLKGLIDTINQTLASDDVNLNTVQKIVDYIKENRDALENLDIEDISGLSDALELAAGASVTIEQAPIPVSMDTTETQVTFNTLHQSTNSDIIEADDTNNVITIKRAGRYQLLSSINLTNTNSQDVVATFKVYDVTTEDLISSRSATIERQTANAPVPSVVVSLDVQVVPISYKFTNIASAGGIAINSTEIMVGTAAGGIGIVEHENTLNRDKADAHPIGAITGLTEELSDIDTRVIDLEKRAQYIEGFIVPKGLDPIMTKVVGDGRIVDAITPYLVTANEDSSLKIVGELQKNNHFKFVNGEYAPVCIVDTPEEVIHPWQTTEDLGYNKMIGFDRPIYLIHYVTKGDFTYFLYSYDKFTYEDIEAEYFDYMLSPSLPTIVGSKFRNLMFMHDYGSHGVGSYGIDIFDNIGYARPQTSMNQLDTNNYSVALNPNSEIISPYAPMMDWAYLAFCYASLAKTGSLYERDVDSYNGGISSLRIPSESTWGTITGIRSRINSEDDWVYNYFAGTCPYYKDASGNRDTWIIALNRYLPHMGTDEIQYALSYATENNISEGVEFGCLSKTYYYKNINNLSTLSQGVMNAQLFRKEAFTFDAYDAEGNTLTGIECEIILQMSAANSIDLYSQDVYNYAGAGTEVIGHIVDDTSGGQNPLNLADIYQCKNQLLLDLSTTEEIAEAEKFSFELSDGYKKIGNTTMINYSDYNFFPGSRFGESRGGSSTLNSASKYLYNYTSAAIGNKVRIAVRGRGPSDASNGSFRFSLSFTRLSTRYSHYAACFQAMRSSKAPT